MNETTIPEWAPAKLVNEYNLMKAADEREKWNYYHRYKYNPEFLVIILYRLLTDLNMKNVWSTLISHPPLDSKLLKQEPVMSLWQSITRALGDFKFQILHPQTTAQKKKKLKNITTKARSLLDAIDKDPTATEIAKRVTAYYLAQKNLEWRENEGETPFWYEYDIPLTLHSDCSEAWTIIRNEAKKL